MAQFPEEQGDNGAFQRQEDAFRDWIEAPEAGRYHLYVCKACPWAHRAWLLLRLMGLGHVVSVNFVDPIRQESTGWAFREGVGHGLDDAEGFEYLAEAYVQTDPDFRARATVPVLWDKQSKRIVNNSEDDICRMWASTFRPLCAHPMEIFPTTIESEHAKLNERIYTAINNGVYAAGFADSQAAYETAFEQLFSALDELEARLVESGGPYLFGERVVEADFRLFCTLVRFDVVYHGHFKCNYARIIDYPHLQEHLERIYRLPRAFCI